MTDRPVEPWPEAAMTRMLVALALRRRAALRPGAPIGPWPTGALGALDLRRDIGLDSMELIDVATEAATRLRLEAAGIEDWLLVKATFAGWAEVAAEAARLGAAEIDWPGAAGWDGPLPRAAFPKAADALAAQVELAADPVIKVHGDPDTPEGALAAGWLAGEAPVAFRPGAPAVLARASGAATTLDRAAVMRLLRQCA